MADAQRAPGGARVEPKNAPSVLVVEHSEEVGELLRVVLGDEGYHVSVVVRSDDVIAAAVEFRPDVVLVDLVPPGEGQSEERVYGDVDRLRGDPFTTALPVVALTTSPRIAETAKASFNVVGALVKPFDLDQVLDSVREALQAPIVGDRRLAEHQPVGALAAAERVVARHSRAALFRWVQRLKQEPPWESREDLGLAGLLDDAPAVIQVLHARLRDAEVSVAEYFRAVPEALERTRAHARTRLGQSIPIDAVAREYAMLREELWTLLERHLPADLATRDTLAVARAIDDTLDAVIQETIRVYQRASETESRP